MTETVAEVTCDCPMQPVYRYTWPGRDEAYACFIHAPQLRTVARIMGFHLQLVPMYLFELNDKHCSQKVRRQYEKV